MVDLGVPTAAADTAIGLAGAYQRDELAPTDVVQRYLDRIAAHDAALGAFVAVDVEGAMVAAEQAQDRLRRRERRSPLDGVPICVKDLTCTKGLPTTFSSRAYGDYESGFDDPIVARIRTAGLVIIGKTNTPEFGALPVTQSELNGVCRNPWDATLTAGGSSGGSAAAVAAAMAPIAHGSDGAGSIRLPATCCGLVGVKPASGLPGRSGVRRAGAVSAMTADGFLTRTVGDARALCSVLLPDEAPDSRSSVRLRIGAMRRPPVPAVMDATCLSALEFGVELLSMLGHSVEPADLSRPHETIVDDMMVARAGIGADFGVDDATLLGPFLAAMAAWRRELSEEAVRQASGRVAKFCTRLRAWISRYDVVLTPAATTPAKSVSWFDETGDCFSQFRAGAAWNAFAPLANLALLPAVSLPVSGTGLPVSVGLQLIGGNVGLATLLELGDELACALAQA